MVGNVRDMQSENTRPHGDFMRWAEDAFIAQTKAFIAAWKVGGGKRVTPENPSRPSLAEAEDLYRMLAAAL